MRRQRPWIVVKVATSQDCAVAAAPGTRTLLTSRQAAREVHRLRAEIDAIAVGSATMLVDDPLLTARGIYRERPLVRVIFDSRLRTSPRAAVFGTLAAGPIVVTTTDRAIESQVVAAAALREAGAELLVAGDHDLSMVLRELTRRDVQAMVVEGGPGLHRAFWASRVVDKVQVFVTPRVLGPSALRWDMPDDLSLASLDRLRVTPLGPDVLVEGECSRG
jgi:diaminohydroxyphosphoribosylaminopyrimidine deaminase/5-amino-6-(5-phosphoribosylamino)uracil reductase